MGIRRVLQCPKLAVIFAHKGFQILDTRNLSLAGFLFALRNPSSICGTAGKPPEQVKLWFKATSISNNLMV